jgi:membrane protein YdbS with pleckstrin-like domain
MTRPDPKTMSLSRQARQVALVLCVTIVAWVVLQMIGREYGWQARFAFLLDFAALAAFVWAMIVTFRIWRQGRDPRG